MKGDELGNYKGWEVGMEKRVRDGGEVLKKGQII